MNPQVMDGFIKSEYITQEMQFEYMKKYSKFYRVAILEDVPVGYVGVIDGDIRICTEPNYQRKGVAKFMLNEILKIFPNAFAKIKLDNDASLKLFESLGFKKKYYILEKDVT
jgi:ribosomal protein S18 acetylase RimI-like enzyme